MYPALSPVTTGEGWECIRAPLLFHGAGGGDCETVQAFREQCHGDFEPYRQKIEKSNMVAGSSCLDDITTR